MITSYTGSMKRKRNGLGAAFLALLAALLIALTLSPQARAQVAGPIVPPAAPKAPTVFPERDFVTADGYNAGDNLTFKIRREGVLIGRASGTVGANGLLEVNHPGGICWGKLQPDNPDGKAVTPDILPGDIVEFETPGGVDRIRTLDVTAEAAVRDENGTPSDPSDDKLVVHGTARDELGNPMPIDNIEQRIVNPDFVPTEVGRRDISVVAGPGGARVPAGADATLVQDGANWTATYTGLSSNVIDLAVAGQTRVLGWMSTDAAGNRLGITIYEAGELGGPGFGGCPLGANYKVKSSSPKSVNVDFQGGNGPLVLSGLAHNASSVEVTLDDTNANTPALTKTITDLVPDPDNPDEQTWKAEFAQGDVLNGLDPGTLTAKARFTIPNPEPPADGTSPTVQIGGAKLEILKDLSRPLAPKADVGSGTYNAVQFVKLSNDPDPSNPDPAAEVHYTVNGTTPTADSRVFRLPIRIASDQTIKAVAIDKAGNKSDVATFNYTFQQNLPPAPAPVPGAPLDPNDPPGVTTNPPQMPHAPTVFPMRDFVTADGYEPDTETEIRVMRNGAVVGRAKGTTNAAGLLEVNHPGGICWEGVTPNIKAGDIVEFEDPLGNVDQVNTLNVTADEAAIEGGNLVVHGTAMGDNGERLPLANIEQRIINPAFKDAGVGRRDIRVVEGPGGARVPAGATATIEWNDPADVKNPNWTATYTGLSPAVMDLALSANGGQTRVLGWQATNAAGDRLGITIYEAGELGGPGIGGCPLGADNAVTASSHYPGVNSFNIGADTGKALVLYGTSKDANAISVTLDDEDPNTPAIQNIAVDPANIFPLTGEQTWFVSIPRADVAAFSDGTLAASATYTVPVDPADPTSGTKQVTGRKLTIQKDTQVPDAPTASPASGTFENAQSVTLDSPDPTAKIHYNVGDKAPGRAAKGFLNPDPIIADKPDQTIHAVAVDPAGNRSAVSSFRYQIKDLTPPAAPTALKLDAASDTGASNTDGITSNTTPTFTGTAEARATIKLFDGTNPNPVGNATVGADGKFSVTASQLVDGTHSITVTATDPTNNESPKSDPPVSITIDTAAPNTTIDSGPTGTVNVTSASFGLSSSEPQGARFQCSLDGAAFATCSSPKTYTGLAPNRAHTFRAQTTDLAGNVEATPVSRTWTIDTVRPTVTRVTPAAGTRNNAATSNVTATFSELMTANTLNTTTVRLVRNSTGVRVAATVTYNAGTRVVTLNPSANLVRGAAYTATIVGGANGVKDAAGNALAVNRTWSFTVIP